MEFREVSTYKTVQMFHFTENNPRIRYTYNSFLKNRLRYRLYAFSFLIIYTVKIRTLQEHLKCERIDKQND